MPSGGRVVERRDREPSELAALMCPIRAVCAARPPRRRRRTRRRGRGGERHPAEADALDHRRVADVERRVLARVAVAQQRVLDRRRGRGEPAAGRPASWIPTSVPLRAISETTLEPSRPPAASDAHLAAAIVRFRKKWWLPAMKRADASPPTRRERRRELADQQVARRLAAHVQLVAHVQPLGGEPEHVDGPACSSSRASAGPSSSRKNRSRSTDSSSPTPNHSVRPGPSLSVENARVPGASSATTQTGIDGEQTPVIGPT